MGESSTLPLLSRRGLMRHGALGAAGIAAIASSGALSGANASASMGTPPDWTNVVDLGADRTGVGDSTVAFQNAVDVGLPIYVPPGTYSCNRGPLVAAPWMRICGNSYGTTTIQCSGCHLFDMDNSHGLLEGVEIDHVTLSATGGDIFHGAHVSRCAVHHCWLVQNSASNAIWNSSSSTGLGTAFMHECCFHFNLEHQHGSPRSISAWHMSASGTSFVCADNWWYANSCYNEGHDSTRWWYRVIGVGRNNRFQKLKFEYPQGGMIRLESCTGCVIDDVTSENLSSLVVGNPLISIATAAGSSVGSGGIVIRNYSRRGGNNNGSGIVDIQLDANAAQLIIDMPNVYSGGTVLAIDAGNARNVTLIGSPGNGNYTTVNDSSLQVIS